MSNELIGIVLICLCLWLVLILSGILYIFGILKDLDKILFDVRYDIEKKKSSPVFWATSLNEYFLEKEDEEGVMLMGAVLKKVSQKRKRQKAEKPLPSEQYSQ